MATRGCTSRAASSEPQVFRVPCTVIRGTPALMMQRSKLRLPEYQASSRQEALGAQLTWGFMIASKSKSHRSDISSSINRDDLEDISQYPEYRAGLFLEVLTSSSEERW